MAMAAALRTAASRVLAQRSSKLLLGVTSTQVQPKQGIKTKQFRDVHGIVRPSPFDYVNKDYTWWRRILDTTTKRIDENSVIIVVEGPVACGKTKLIEYMAKELDMHYLPAVNMDHYLINEYGFDMRKLDALLPEDAHSFDNNNFLKTPDHKNVATYQWHLFRLKYLHYIDALAHVLNTGQGVILERSCYSDFVFVEAMLKSKYVSKNFHRAYYEIRDNTIPILLNPHLVVYLDVPVNVTQENIRKRNNALEVNSPVFKSDAFLNDIEYFYKQEFLKDISNDAELLVYDWSHGGEPDIVVEDITRIDFSNVPRGSRKFRDWRFLFQEPDWADARATFTNDYTTLMSNMEHPVYYCPELFLEPEDAALQDNVWNSAPGTLYAPGFNRDMGDKNLLFHEDVPKPLRRK